MQSLLPKDTLFKNIFNRTGPILDGTELEFYLRRFRLIKWSFFVHISMRNASYIHPRLDSRIVPTFPDWGRSMICKCVIFWSGGYNYFFSCSTQLSTKFQLLIKLKSGQMKKFLALSFSDVVFIMLMNVKMALFFDQDTFRAQLSWV